MSIHQTKDGRHFVKYYVRDPETGKKNKEKREMFGRGHEAKIKAYERDTILKAAGKISPYSINQEKPDEPIFADLANEYTTSRKNDMAKTSINNLFYKLQGVILPEIGTLPIPRLTHHRIDQYVSKRLKTPVIKRLGKNSAITKVFETGSPFTSA